MKCKKMNDNELKCTNTMMFYWKRILNLVLTEQFIHECLEENTNNQNVKCISQQIRKGANYYNENDLFQWCFYIKQDRYIFP